MLGGLFHYFQKNDRLGWALLLLLVSGLLIWLTKDFPFYWDNVVQLSVPANWFYQHRFATLLLPDAITTGHPPLGGMYLAGVWMLLGRSLWISHLAMWPFVFGLLYQLKRLADHLKIEPLSLKGWLLAFVYLDATFLSQLSLITFDVIHLFALFWSVNALLSGRRDWLYLSFSLLLLISLRGAISGAGLVLFYAAYRYGVERQPFRLADYRYFLPGAGLLLAFLVYFSWSKGWIVHNTTSQNWTDAGTFADAKGILKNTALFIWRWIDFGRICWVIVGILAMGHIVRRWSSLSTALQVLFLMGLSQLLVFFPLIVIYQNPFGHRYLLPLLIPFCWFSVYWVWHYARHRQLILLGAWVVLLSGHFWRYPLQVSQGWDSTTLHWHYFYTSEKIHGWLAENDVPLSEVTTFFPLYSPRSLTHIEKDTTDFRSYPCDPCRYAIFSNAFNEPDDVIADFYGHEQKWKPVVTYSRGGIYTTLFERLSEKESE
ncbi:MAG: hypothetical protein R2795_26850 [Saprospiraceae bacterium]